MLAGLADLRLFIVLKHFRATSRYKWTFKLSLHSLEECIFWLWHVTAGCAFQCTLTSAPVIPLSLNVNTPKPPWAQQIPGRINAGLNQINTIQACSIGVSIQTYRETADSACDEGGPSNAESSRLSCLMFPKAATLVDRFMPGASSELISLQPHWDTGTWALFPRTKAVFCLFIVHMSALLIGSQEPCHLVVRVHGVL